MSSSKSNYPERPSRPRPKKPGKGTGKPSSHKGSRKSKTWLSERTNVANNNVDMSPRLGFAWWQSPMFREARLKKWSK